MIHMKRILKTAAALMALCALALCMSACSSTKSSKGEVAATVNGTKIYEEDITNYIENLRVSYGLDDDTKWYDYMSLYGYTAADIRTNIIESFVVRALIVEAAAESGITANQSEIDSYVSEMKANYDSNKAWEEALEKAGLTEDEYRNEIEIQLVYNELYKTFLPSENPTEEELLNFANIFADAYDGAKRSSHILFDAADEETAAEVLEKLQSGELEFADAAKQYSTDSSADDGGDVGWDATSSFIDVYQEALDMLDKGEMSGLVESSYGIHIILCTDVFTAPRDDNGNVNVTSLDEIPEAWVEDFTISEEAELYYANMYATSYDGAKKSSQILFSAEDEETASEVLARLQSGELTFTDAVAQYSTDTSVDEDGNMGWDKASSYDDEYQDALDKLSKGEMSGLVESDSGISIILCTDEFSAPLNDDGDVDVTSMDQLPQDWQDEIIEGLQETVQSYVYSAWIESAENKADIAIVDMPEGLPYDITAEDTAAESSDGSTDNSDSSDENASDENADDNDTGDGDESADDESSDLDKDESDDTAGTESEAQTSD